MTHLGFNLYYFADLEAQNRLLLEGVAPAVEKLRAEGVRRFFYDRFDIRGPHFFGIVTVDDERLDTVRDALAAAFDTCLEQHPSPGSISEEHLRLRHEGCLGKELCVVDHEPGFAPDNSHRFFEQPADGYPFGLTRSMPSAETFWESLDDLGRYTVAAVRQRGGKAATGPALAWMASLDRALVAADLDAADYYRYHATTLLGSLRERLRDDEDDVIAGLPKAVAKNRAAFDRFFLDEEAVAPWPGIDRLVAAATDSPPASWPWAPLREAVHCTLKQFGVPVRTHVPIMLYGWLRHLESKAAPALAGEVGR